MSVVEIKNVTEKTKQAFQDEIDQVRAKVIANQSEAKKTFILMIYNGSVLIDRKIDSLGRYNTIKVQCTDEQLYLEDALNTFN